MATIEWKNGEWYIKNGKWRMAYRNCKYRMAI